jgi:predicted nucleic acid-binding protein
MRGGSFFLDTNIIVYALQSDSPEKMKIADELMTKAAQGKGVISFQVVQEFVNLALSKFRPTPPVEEIQQLVQDVLLPLCKVVPNPAFYLEALITQRVTRYSWYDCLILQAAVESGCDTLYSEDFQNGFRYRGVTVKNPFR